MPTWFIEPRDPLIVRDGRPFGADPGARARSLGFPMPSTTTGGLRSRAGLTKDRVFDKERIAEVLQIAVRGPLLAALDQEGRFVEWLPPAPADALLVHDEKNHRDQLLHLVPLALPPEADYSRPAGAEDLVIVGPTVAVNKKPLAQPPRYWHWDQYLHWLTEPERLAAHLQANTTLGIAGPTVETRTHVSIDPGTQTAEEGRLFQTNGLEFTTADRNRLTLVIESAAPVPHFDGGFAPLGGERRLMAWRKADHSLPTCPDPIRERIKADRACRLILLTPAYFTAGYRPTWVLSQRGLTATLVAAVVQRPQVISGWDMKEGKPKPTRRLAPAGSVFFLKLPETATVAQLNDWIDAIWMQNISDNPQDRLDGFGLAILGAWDGKLTAMEVK